jgi:hypothetical protein
MFHGIHPRQYTRKTSAEPGRSFPASALLGALALVVAVAPVAEAKPGGGGGGGGGGNTSRAAFLIRDYPDLYHCDGTDCPTYDFGTSDVDLTRSFVIRNVGTTSTKFMNVTFGGTETPDVFQMLLDDCPSTLRAGYTCVFTMRFKPDLTDPLGTQYGDDALLAALRVTAKNADPLEMLFQGTYDIPGSSALAGSPTAVPEPSTLAMFATGAALLWGLRYARRRNHRAVPG